MGEGVQLQSGDSSSRYLTNGQSTAVPSPITMFCFMLNVHASGPICQEQLEGISSNLDSEMNCLDCGGHGDCDLMSCESKNGGFDIRSAV